MPATFPNVHPPLARPLHHPHQPQLSIVLPITRPAAPKMNIRVSAAQNHPRLLHIWRGIRLAQSLPQGLPQRIDRHPTIDRRQDSLMLQKLRNEVPRSFLVSPA